MKLSARFCPICGTESSHLHREENFKFENLNSFSFASRKEPEPFHMCLYLCEKCDLIYANPVLEQEIVKHEYQNASFDSSIEAAYAARTYAKYAPKNQINSALDIGCGGGEFLLELQKKGVKDLRGIEPSFVAIETANPQIKNCIKQGFFDKNLYAENQFDLVSCFQTLEHVYDPLKLSKDSYSLLKPQGKFFVVSHNFRGTLNQIIKNKSPIYDIEHLQLFSEKSLEKMLLLAGFSEVKIFPIINNYPLFYWIKLVPKFPLKKQIFDFVKKIKIGYLPVPLPIGNIAAIAIK